MKSTSTVCVAALALLLGGCATIISGSSQNISVNSNVEGAQVSLNGKPLGATPLVVEIPRGQTGTLTVQKPGYKPFNVAINKQINGVFWVNILLGGTFGSSTDYSTGAMYKYEPATYFASLQPEGQTPAEREEWRRKESLRAFILMNNEALVADLAASEGEYLDALLQLLAVGPDNREKAILRWRAGYLASNTAVQFAERIVAEL